MPVRFQQACEPNSHYSITFTFYKWLPLFEQANAYDLVYRWFDYLYTNNIFVTGYVIMPNHMHVLLYFPNGHTSLNTLIGNAKRLMAYEIIKRLKKKGCAKLLDELHGDVSRREQKKGQVHKVFEDSFDAKECHSREFLYQKIDYIHHNPVRKKWNLVNDFTLYAHSSADFYATGVKRYPLIMHIEDALNYKGPGSRWPAHSIRKRRPRADGRPLHTTKAPYGKSTVNH